MEGDRLLCAGCAQDVPPVPPRCYRCKAVTDGYITCRDCRGETPLCQVLVATHYRDFGKELLHRTKYERARSGAVEMAALMTPLLRYVPDDVVLVHVPTATARVRQRGYDHARLLVRALSQATALPVSTPLRRIGQAHQVGAGRAERLHQLHGAFRVVYPGSMQGKHIVLVDDVLTTGVTLETAARELKKTGAKQVSALVFAQA